MGAVICRWATPRPHFRAQLVMPAVFSRSVSRRRHIAFARRVGELLARTPLSPLLGSRLVTRLRRELIVMRARDVQEVLDALSGAAVPAWIAGGWGVDALLGESSRDNGDVDVVVDCYHTDAARHAIVRL